MATSTIQETDAGLGSENKEKPSKQKSAPSFQDQFDTQGDAISVDGRLRQVYEISVGKGPRKKTSWRIHEGSQINIYGSYLGIYHEIILVINGSLYHQKNIHPQQALDGRTTISFKVNEDVKGLYSDASLVYLKFVDVGNPKNNRFLKQTFRYYSKTKEEEEQENREKAGAQAGEGKNALGSEPDSTAGPVNLVMEAMGDVLGGTASALAAGFKTTAQNSSTQKDATAKTTASSTSSSSNTTSNARGSVSNDSDDDLEQGEITGQANSIEQDVQTSTTDISGGTQTISQSGTVSEAQTAQISGGGTVQTDGSIAGTISGTQSATGQTILQSTTVGAAQVSGQSGAASGGGGVISSTVNLGGNFSSTGGTVGVGLPVGGAVQVETKSQDQVNAETQTPGGGKTSEEARGGIDSSSTASTGGSAGQGAIDISVKPSSEVAKDQQNPISAPTSSQPVSAGLRAGSSPQEKAQTVGADSSPAKKTARPETKNAAILKSSGAASPTGATSSNGASKALNLSHEGSSTEEGGNKKEGQDKNNLPKEGVSPKPPAGLDQIKKNNLSGDSLNRTPANNQEGQPKSSGLVGGGGAIDKNAHGSSGLLKSTDSGSGQSTEQQQEESGGGENGKGNQKTPTLNPNQENGQSQQSKERNAEAGEDEVSDDRQEDTPSRALIGRQDSLKEKETKQKSIDEALKKAIALFNRWMNIALLEGAAVLWTVIWSTLGLASIIIAPILDIVLVFKSSIIKSFINSRLGKLADLVGEDMEGKGDEIAKEIKLSRSVKLNIWGMNLMAVGVAFLIIVFAVTLTKALCDNWITGGIGYLKGYSSVCTDLDSLTSNLNNSINTNGQNAASQVNVNTTPSGIAPRGANP